MLYRLVIALIVIGGLAIVVAGVLLAPVRVSIDTTKGRYDIDWARFFRFRLLPVQNDLKLRLTVFGWPKEWSLMQQIVRRKGKKDRSQKPPGKSKSRMRIAPSRMPGILATFRIRKWCIELDTDNYITNAYLDPVFRYLDHRGNGRWRINYTGDITLIMTIENNMWRLLYAWIKPADRTINNHFLNLINTMP